MKTEKTGQTVANSGHSICAVCRNEFTPIITPQLFCSGTCARAVRDIDELGRVYAVLDDRHLRAYMKSGRSDG